MSTANDSPAPDDSPSSAGANVIDDATSHVIDDDHIERAKLLLGVDVPGRNREHVQTLTTDNIRAFAFGIGSGNPLHCDPAYGAKTRWGSVIAPGMVASLVNRPMLADPMDAALKAKTRGLFHGVHIFVSGGSWEWYRPMYPGDTIFSFNAEESLTVNPSKFAGRSVSRVRRDVRLNQHGEIIAVYRMLRIFAERKAASTSKKYGEIRPKTYSDADLAEIDEIYANETIRGAEKRYFEDVEIDDAMGIMAKGPLTVTDIICMHGSGYGFAPFAPAVGRLGYENRQRIPGFYVKNELGVPDTAQRVHWDPVWAQAIGNPMPFDYGVMREHYLYQFITNWCGDDAIVLKVHDEVRRFNYMGDLQIITGTVTGKRQEADLSIVEVAVQLVNQRDEVTVHGTAEIALPSRTRGLPQYPAPPRDLGQRATEMMARHWALSAQS